MRQATFHCTWSKFEGQITEKKGHVRYSRKISQKAAKKYEEFEISDVRFQQTGKNFAVKFSIKGVQDFNQ